MKKILIGIPCIDRDVKYLNNLLKIIKENEDTQYHLNIAIATRIKDKETIQVVKNRCILLICDNYQIQGRHNVANIAIKRNKILKYAKQKQYDYVLFIDADILPYNGFIKDLLDINTDVSAGLYAVRWYENKPICLTENGIKELRELNGEKIIMVGFGCCLIDKKLFHIPVKRLKVGNKECMFDGEDFYWFKDIYEKGYDLKVLKKEIRHIVD